MPLVGISMAIFVLGIAGAPLFIGSVSKYYMGYGAPVWFEWLLRFLSLATIISFTKYGLMLFGKDPGIKGYEYKPDRWRVWACLFWATLVLLGGIFGPQAINWMYSSDLSLDLLTKWNFSDGFFAGLLGGYWGKGVWWVILSIVGYFIFTFVIKGNPVLKKLGKLDLGFKTIIASITIFFGILLAVVGFGA